MILQLTIFQFFPMLHRYHRGKYPNPFVICMCSDTKYHIHGGKIVVYQSNIAIITSLL